MNVPNQRIPDDKNHCCHIPCDQPARFLVRAKVMNSYEDYTHACGDHVEDLKCAADDVVERL